jgi:DNA-directed RNA polymerase specialized sigma subunit
MTAKKYLSQAYLLDQSINSKIEQVSSLNDLARKATSVVTGMPHSPNKGKSPMADSIGKIIDLQNEINEDIDRLVDLKSEIMSVINGVDDVECRLLLEKRYLSCESWEYIAAEMGFSLPSVYRLHDRALKSVVVPNVDSK